VVPFESRALARAIADYKVDPGAVHVQPFLIFILAMDNCQMGKFQKVVHQRADPSIENLAQRLDTWDSSVPFGSTRTRFEVLYDDSMLSVRDMMRLL
jgi:hypothetical protein